MKIDIMNFLNWLTSKKTPEEELLEKFCHMDLLWKYTHTAFGTFFSYKATFPGKEPSNAGTTQHTIEIWEDYNSDGTCYRVCIDYSDTEKPLAFHTKTRAANKLIQQARAQIKARDDESAHRAQHELQEQCKNVFKLLP